MVKTKMLHIALIVVCLICSTFATNKWAGLGVNSDNATRTLQEGQISTGIHSTFSIDGTLLRDKRILRDNVDRGLNNIPIANQYFGVSYGVIDAIDLGVSLPFYILDTPGTLFFGDVLYQAKYNFSDHIRLPKMIRMALALGGNIPVSTDKGYIPRAIENIPQKHQGGPLDGEFAGDYKPGSTNHYGIHTNFALGLDFSQWFQAPTEFIGNVGTKSPELWTDDNYFHILTYSVGASIDLHPAVSFYSGYHREQRIEQEYSSYADVSEVQFVFEFFTPSGISLHTGVNVGIFNDAYVPIYLNGGATDFATKGSPDYAFSMGLNWSGFLTAQDFDGDGFIAEADKCPHKAEDKDGFEDKDGCPDEDNDQDKIADVDDQCPNKSEDPDGFEDKDGCPDLDNDNDQIVDIQDKCPMIAEDFDNFEDKDGCPEEDNDKDQIADASDKCPTDPEDYDNFEDSDGCPELDNDKDQIADATDKCPNKAEVFNGFLDKDGCPDVKPKENFAELAREILFSTGTSNLKIRSKVRLDSVANLLHEYPQVQMRVEGHTDNISTIDINTKLSEARANSVLRYLVSKGISGDRILSQGFGPTKPIGDNKTSRGRARNRRVELIPIQ